MDEFNDCFQEMSKQVSKQAVDSFPEVPGVIW